ncbi:MAG: response regulator, partial [Candidatus Rokuibacteriota bacterium]
MPEHTILVVDDEQAQRTVLAGFLKKRGFAVLQASGVAEALAQVSSHLVDLVLTDLRMTDGTGLDVLNGVRTINPEVAVVVMTAFGTVS